MYILHMIVNMLYHTYIYIYIHTCDKHIYIYIYIWSWYSVRGPRRMASTHESRSYSFDFILTSFRPPFRPHAEDGVLTTMPSIVYEIKMMEDGLDRTVHE